VQLENRRKKKAETGFKAHFGFRNTASIPIVKASLSVGILQHLAALLPCVVGV
jgi:hypothetical protein